MTKKVSDGDLVKLYKDRLKDRAQATTKRRRQLNAHPHKVSSLLGDYFKQDSQALARIEESRALQAWEAIVGSTVSRVSQPVRIRNHTLVVRVADPLWMQQLCLLKADLLRKFQRGFPKLQLRDIFFTR